MCLAVPVRVVSIEDSRAVAEVGGVTLQISIALTPEVRAGDYVLLHAGYAIGVIDEAEALETLRLFEEMAALECNE
ncbi:MAG: HypC/HybG/HupF family hydrogenase formation chaperone [Chloroflexota bacterium]